MHPLAGVVAHLFVAHVKPRTCQTKRQAVDGQAVEQVTMHYILACSCRCSMERENSHLGGTLNIAHHEGAFHRAILLHARVELTVIRPLRSEVADEQLHLAAASVKRQLLTVQLECRFHFLQLLHGSGGNLQQVPTTSDMPRQKRESEHEGLAPGWTRKVFAAQPGTVAIII